MGAESGVCVSNIITSLWANLELLILAYDRINAVESANKF